MGVRGKEVFRYLTCSARCGSRQSRRSRRCSFNRSRRGGHRRPDRALKMADGAMFLGHRGRRGDACRRMSIGPDLVGASRSGIGYVWTRGLKGDAADPEEKSGGCCDAPGGS